MDIFKMVFSNGAAVWIGVLCKYSRWCNVIFLLRNASAERGYEIACHPSVHLSVPFLQHDEILDINLGTALQSSAS